MQRQEVLAWVGSTSRFFLFFFYFKWRPFFSFASSSSVVPGPGSNRVSEPPPISVAVQVLNLGRECVGEGVCWFFLNRLSALFRLIFQIF